MRDVQPALVELLLSLADDKFLLGHANAEWTGLAPILEEDIAFSSLAQDELAHASALYQHVGKLTGRRADDLAYGRRPEEYRCAAIVELPDESDWSVALARQFYCDHFDVLRLERLAQSSDRELAALCARLLAEERVHIGHDDDWIVRLGRGGEESHAKMQAALGRLAPQAAMLFEPPAGVDKLEAAGVYPRGPRDMFEKWAATVEAVAQRGGLSLDLRPPHEKEHGGRRGRRSDAFAATFAELTEVYRVEPEAKW